MNDFIMAALPWICIGVVLAIFMVTASNKVNNKTQDDYTKDSQRKDDNYMLIGMCLGMCIGCALSITGIISTSYGISFGMLIGMAIGSTIKKQN